MGRKQKLREEKKRRIKDNPPSAAVVTALATATTKTVSTTALPTGNAHLDYLNYLDREFPVSVEYAQVVANITSLEEREIFELCKRGTNYNCVHSLHGMGKFMQIDGPDRYILAISFYLRGAIMGSCQCAWKLFSLNYIPAKALQFYWIEMAVEYGYDKKLYMKEHIYAKEHKDLLMRKCAMCSKSDTSTLSLLQCQGCNFYCYCSAECQTLHWDKYNHRGECKQLHILNKYHKPYAKEIRDAVIRGDHDTDILALEKLRYKLGVVHKKKPEELTENPFIPHEGISNDPRIFFGARRDGTVCIAMCENRVDGSVVKAIYEKEV
ncbi:hypothetical protein FRACYDRAFT_252600 [Fragilariopsis cylindrus CCMP1102]|uniref:MYND-type domain-containing protein n=1 Tax=Fragilariopsis cylindrus CCMP1102 TaxID=635003 RepID=A0A1E7EM19_9STRA|nr:hypothetical protein FRACYDRAFT_252600 [Fragilariopsis cylindrus CCMP1102]|eukprot:OEU06968.1 hypothetical protein FRACYDRAFT_252600 [Fragilariopsis cylindrus CCMP1102]